MIAVACCIVIGLAIRFAAASGAPWLDELWSWQMASAGEVLVAHDNNHLLNTAWLWLVGDTGSPIVWRLPAVLSGAATIFMTAMILRRFGRMHAVAGALLVAVCHPLVVYQSEARGYAPMLLCMSVAIELQLRLIEGHGRTRLLRLGMAIVATLGVLSHLSFAIFYALLAVSSLIPPPGVRQARTTMSRMLDHAGGLALIAVWYIGFGRRMSIGGGPELGTWAVLKETAAMLAGVDPVHAWWLILVLPFGIAACALAARQRAPHVVILLCVIAVGYPLIALAAKDRLIYVRYFLPAVLAILMLTGAALGETLRRGHWRPFAAAALGLLVCLHASRLIPLLHEGRDQHRLAIARMQEQSPGTVASECEFQLRTILDYHRRFHADRELPAVVAMTESPDWLVVMRPGGPAELHTLDGEYRLAASYKAHHLSGIPWMLYRRTSGTDFHSAQTRTE